MGYMPDKRRKHSINEIMIVLNKTINEVNSPLLDRTSCENKDRFVNQNSGKECLLRSVKEKRFTLPGGKLLTLYFVRSRFQNQAVCA